jgi:glycogen debranching enzyme
MPEFFDKYVTEPLVERNVFRSRRPQDAPLPTFEESRELLPSPAWPARPEAVSCYWKVWELVFQHLRRPTADNGFVSNYIDTAFNDHLFLWDSAFILLFARYGRRAFDFQRTLDNLYAKQHPDGFICREIVEEDGRDFFHRHDPNSTGPNVLGWCEWEYFLNFSDRRRLEQVLPVLRAYHQWLRLYRTWKDGSYWSSGLGCGMDNQPRTPGDYWDCYHHGHMAWIDACCQQVLSADLLLKMSDVLNVNEDLSELQDERDTLARFVNERMWDDRSSFYVDRFADGTLSPVKTIGAYWALLAGLVPSQRVNAFTAHLDNPGEFKRPHRVPTLSADHPGYDPAGGYWKGGVWPPTNYMALRGLTRAGKDELAHAIGRNHVERVTEVFEDTGTVWENYAPESAGPGKPAKSDFVGWGGVGPVAVLMEYVFGLRPEAQQRRLVWDVRLTDAHGVERYPFRADGLLDLHCASRSSADEEPQLTVTSTVPLTLDTRWAGGSRQLDVPAATG